VRSDEELIILLVEDNAAHAEIIRRSFEDQDVPSRIYHVTDGEAALDYLFRRKDYADEAASPRPHVVLLDLRLPKVDGLDVLKVIKSTNLLRTIPVIVLTSSEAEGDVAGAYDNHANSYLVKPANYENFVELMGQIGLYWSRWNRSMDASNGPVENNSG
jgi:CheY-like chemotaxis protein